MSINLRKLFQSAVRGLTPNKHTDPTAQGGTKSSESVHVTAARALQRQDCPRRTAHQQNGSPTPQAQRQLPGHGPSASPELAQTSYTRMSPCWTQTPLKWALHIRMTLAGIGVILSSQVLTSPFHLVHVIQL